ncbi:MULTISPECIES: hypothetical protein [unclassified Nostoc]|nr:hypothetical protein [Nostoc sp. ChiQUE02]MDZ8233131.1 hypothetical protein [Nostoc sp. ChiQUE02]
MERVAITYLCSGLMRSHFNCWQIVALVPIPNATPSLPVFVCRW